MKLKYFSPCHRQIGSFDSSIPDFKRYWEEQLNLDVKRHLCAGYVLLTDSEDDVIGYFTLSQNSVERDRDDNEKGTYVRTPATLLGRLAVNKKYEKQGYGKELIKSILNLHLKVSRTIGSAVLILKPLEEARGFYNRLQLFSDYGGYLCIKTKKIKRFIEELEKSRLTIIDVS